MAKKAFITGITGQDGSYLAELLLAKDYQVHGLIRRSSSFNTGRIDQIYQDPHVRDRHLFLHYGDLTDGSNLNQLIKNIKPDEIYHLGAQSHVKVSFDIPEYTADVTGLGTLRLLDAIRGTGTDTKFYQASSSEMFGSAPAPQNEHTPFEPRSPYAIAKVFAYWMVRNYREAYGMFACNGILFNHECLTAQTPIIIQNNDLIDIVAIEEIVPHRENPRHGIKYITFCNGDLEVWNGANWTKIKTLTATWNKAGSLNDKKVRQIICRGGYYEATSDHISFLQGGREIKTGGLKKNDLLELKSFPDLRQKTVMSLEEAEFLGMMVADGYISEDGRGRFINNDNNLRNKVQNLWQKISGGYSREDKHPSGFNKNKDVFSIELAGNPQYLRLIAGEIYTQKLFKKIPKLILNANKEIILAFLNGYNNCDGLKGGRQKTRFKSFTTNSSVLALGLWYLANKALGLRITIHPEFRKDFLYFHLNINSDNKTQKGKHLQREISEIKAVKDYNYTGWLFDLETESGTLSAGVGLTWVHNSPRRGETFVTRKITRAIANIIAGKQDKLYLGNLDAKRDWGYAREYVEAMWLMLQQPQPDDYVIATGQTHTVREFLAAAFAQVGLRWEQFVELDPRYLRPTEINELMGDASKAKKILGWQPKVTFTELVKIMVEADCQTTIGETWREKVKKFNEAMNHRTRW